MDDTTKTGGRLDVSRDTVQDNSIYMDSIIAAEEARLEKTLTDLQRQMSTVNMLNTTVFGS